jgi:hypothetical protein
MLLKAAAAVGGAMTVASVTRRANAANGGNFILGQTNNAAATTKLESSAETALEVTYTGNIIGKTAVKGKSNLGFGVFGEGNIGVLAQGSSGVSAEGTSVGISGLTRDGFVAVSGSNESGDKGVGVLGVVGNQGRPNTDIRPVRVGVNGLAVANPAPGTGVLAEGNGGIGLRAFADLLDTEDLPLGIGVEAIGKTAGVVARAAPGGVGVRATGPEGGKAIDATGAVAVAGTLAVTAPPGANAIETSGPASIAGDLNVDGSISGRLDASMITSGRLSGARLPAGAARRNAPNTFQRINVFLKRVRFDGGIVSNSAGVVTVPEDSNAVTVELPAGIRLAPDSAILLTPQGGRVDVAVAARRISGRRFRILAERTRPGPVTIAYAVFG